MISGIWTVVVVKSGSYELLSRIPVLVFPTKNGSMLRDGPLNKEIPEVGKLLLQIYQETESEIDKAFGTLNKSCLKYSRNQWQKLLANEFYLIDSLCQIYDDDGFKIEDPAMVNPYRYIPFCEETLWSSLSPDPKSSIL